MPYTSCVPHPVPGDKAGTKAAAARIAKMLAQKEVWWGILRLMKGPRIQNWSKPGYIMWQLIAISPHCNSARRLIRKQPVESYEFLIGMWHSAWKMIFFFCGSNQPWTLHIHIKKLVFDLIRESATEELHQKLSKFPTSNKRTEVRIESKCPFFIVFPKFLGILCPSNNRTRLIRGQRSGNRQRGHQLQSALRRGEKMGTIRSVGNEVGMKKKHLTIWPPPKYQPFWIVENQQFMFCFFLVLKYQKRQACSKWLKSVLVLKQQSLVIPPFELVVGRHRTGRKQLAVRSHGNRPK